MVELEIVLRKGPFKSSVLGVWIFSCRNSNGPCIVMKSLFQQLGFIQKPFVESIRSFVMLTERSISCRGAGVILTLAKKKNGNWESFAKRYVPRNPGSVIFVDANLFGVVEMVGKFERELYGTTVGSISRSVSLAPRPGHATSPKPYNRWKIIGYGWTVPVYHRVLWAKLNLNTIACPK